MTKLKAKLIVNNKEIELPIKDGSMGYPAIDVSTLHANSIKTFDPGFSSTAECSSAITFVDGGKGELLHRGHPIEQLAEKCEYLDIAFLLFNGELPNSREKVSYVKSIKEHSLPHDQLKTIFQGFHGMELK